MDSFKLSVEVSRVLQEASNLNIGSKNDRECKYDLVLLFARIWLLKAEIFSTTDLTPPFMEDFITALHTGSSFLQASLSFPPLEEKTEYQILEIIQQVPEQVKLLYRSHHGGVDLLGNRLMGLLYKFLVQAMLFNAEALLLGLLKNVASYIIPLKGQIGTLHQGIMSVIKSQPNGRLENGKLMLEDVEEVASSVISLCNCFPADSLPEGVFKSLELQLSDSLRKVQLVMGELCIQTPCFDFPKVPGICFVEFLSQNLRHLLSCKQDWLSYAAHPVEVICRDLEFIVSELVDASGPQILDCQARLVHAAYQVEFVIGSMVLGNDTRWQTVSSLYHLWDEIANIKVQVTEFFKDKACGGLGGPSIGQNLIPPVSPVTTPRPKDVMVGVGDKKTHIINRLTRGTIKLEVISIVGMPGIGKSTLAMNVFNHPSVARHFNIRAWCHVSQTYTKIELLRSILFQVSQFSRNMILVMNGEDLETLFYLLFKGTKGSRYLIVLDDMWGPDVWDDLEHFWPDDRVGSRILVTSRIPDVVSRFSDPLILHPLSDDKSWELLSLKMRLGNNEAYPEDLLKLGKKIAMNCKGLPLAIGVVAGLLDEAEESKESWKQIAERVSSRVLNEQNMHIFDLSYQHLPDHLKACFLYLGAFAKDSETDIPVQKLLSLWISEGFIRQEESKCLEDLAEKYLNDLINRGLVQVSKITTRGLIKACRVQNLVLEFCRSKVKDENFLQLISCEDEPYSSPAGVFIAYRLCMNQEQFVQQKLFARAQYARSLSLFAQPNGPCDISFIFNDLMLLRVLDLESINTGNSMVKGMEVLLDLRYLAFCGEMESIPPSISNLQYLETLVVKGLKGKVVLPDTLWSMTKLRHVHVTSHTIFTFPDDTNQRYFSKLESLVTLSFPCFSLVEEANRAISMIPNLRKFKCRISEPKFPEFGNLSHLESLKLSYSGSVWGFGTVNWNLPSTLRKLTLSNLKLPWDQISAIGRLPNLEVLKLFSRAFEGEIWEMTEGEFVRLRYLKLDTLVIVQWNISDDCLYCLEQLVLRNCIRLQEVPYNLSYSSNLERIEVHRCGYAVEESVREIVETQLDFGNKDLITSFS